VEPPGFPNNFVMATSSRRAAPPNPVAWVLTAGAGRRLKRRRRTDRAARGASSTCSAGHTLGDVTTAEEAGAVVMERRALDVLTAQCLRVRVRMPESVLPLVVVTRTAPARFPWHRRVEDRPCRVFGVFLISRLASLR
jgi:hypothetical protein